MSVKPIIAVNATKRLPQLSEIIPSNEPLTDEEKEVLTTHGVIPESFFVDFVCGSEKVAITIMYNGIEVLRYPYVECTPYVEKHNGDQMFKVVQPQIMAITREILENNIPPMIFRKLVITIKGHSIREIAFLQDRCIHWDSNIVGSLTRNERFALQKRVDTANKHQLTLQQIEKAKAGAPKTIREMMDHFDHDVYTSAAFNVDFQSQVLRTWNSPVDRPTSQRIDMALDTLHRDDIIEGG